MPVDVVRGMGGEIVIGVDVLCMGQSRRHDKPIKKKTGTELTPRFESRHLAAVKTKINTLLQEHGHRIKILDELYRRAEPWIDSARAKVDPKAPSIFDVLMQLQHAMEYERMKLSLEAADMVISPDVRDIGAFAFHKGEEAISEGYRAAKDALPRLRGIIGCC
jgi:predicted acylesterase/phospholipase RssA